MAAPIRITVGHKVGLAFALDGDMQPPAGDYVDARSYDELRRLAANVANSKLTVDVELLREHLKESSSAPASNSQAGVLRTTPGADGDKASPAPAVGTVAAEESGGVGAGEDRDSGKSVARTGGDHAELVAPSPSTAGAGSDESAPAGDPVCLGSYPAHLPPTEGRGKSCLRCGRPTEERA